MSDLAGDNFTDGGWDGVSDMVWVPYGQGNGTGFETCSGNGCGMGFATGGGRAPTVEACCRTCFWGLLVGFLKHATAH